MIGERFSYKLKYYGIYDKVNVILLSDHGFQEVKQQNMINYSSVLKPGTYQAFGASPVINILPNPGMTEEVHKSLLNLSRSKNFSVYRKEEMEPDWYYSKNRRIMPIVLVADLGFVFEDFEEYIKYYIKQFNITPSPDRVYGVHGYDNRLPSMRGFFMAHGPAFRIGYQGDVFDNIDLYPLICKIIWLQPAPNNGSLSIVSHLLRKEEFQTSKSG